MKAWRRRYWLIALAVVYLLLSAVGGALLVEITLRPPIVRPVNEAAQKRAQEIAQRVGGSVQSESLKAADGVELHAWLIAPARERANGHSVVLLHGVTDSRIGVLGYAPFLLERGYALLLPDARAHGQSGGLATYGLLERDDIRQWARLLRTRATASPGATSSCIYAFGASMGAAMALQSLDGDAHDFCAVVADSSFASFREVGFDRVGQQFSAGPWLGRTLLRPLIEFAFLYGRAKYGFAFNKVSPENAMRSSSVDVLLIHGEADDNIPIRHAHALQRARPTIHFWPVPGASHTAAHAAAKDEYERRILAWFEQHKVPTVAVHSPAK